MWFLFKILLRWRAKELDQFELYKTQTKYGHVYITFSRMPDGAIDQYVSIDKSGSR